MDICTDCLEYEIPACAETIIFDMSGIEIGSTYFVSIENHFGAKQILEIESLYTTSLYLDVSDLPDGYFFDGNIYQVKFYESQTDVQCDNALNICGYETCINLRVKDITGETTVIIECCT